MTEKDEQLAKRIAPGCLAVLAAALLAWLFFGGRSGGDTQGDKWKSPGDEMTVQSDMWVACREREFTERLLRYVLDKDDAAYSSAINLGKAVKVCIQLRANDTYILQGTQSGLLHIRKRGETETYWAIAGALK
jgi:hypothetical protein